MCSAALLNYKDLLKGQNTHFLRVNEIPIEYAISLPIPTLRLDIPAFAFFAAPTLRRPNVPTEQAAPDRWWLIDARTGRLIYYALWKVFPFIREVSWCTASFMPARRSVAEFDALLDNVITCFNTLSPAFFAGDPSDPIVCQSLAEALDSLLEKPIFPQYHALAPDFFAWFMREL
jgi:hypothetical protein